MMMTDGTTREPPVYVYYTRPRCPYCGSLHLRSNHSDDNGDGTVTRQSKCQTCRKNVVVIAE